MAKVCFRDATNRQCKFHLDDNGRVEVAKVLGFFGASQVQFKDEDGVLCELQQKEDGQSLDTFQPGSTVAIEFVTRTVVGSGLAVYGVPVPKPLGRDEILALLDDFCDDKRPSLKMLPRDEKDYKAKFPSSLGAICSVGGQACLLWEGVGSGLVEVDPRFMARLHEQALTVVLAPSGSGKTRTLIELASKRFSLFLTGNRPQNGFGGGSRDLQELARTVVRLYSGRTDLIDKGDAGVGCCVRALVLERLCILRLLKELKPDLSPRDWAFFQLEYPAVQDVFKELAQSLMCIIHDISQCPHYDSTFGSLIWYFIQKVDWRHGLIVLDEAQELLKVMTGRFTSTVKLDEGQSLLNPFVLALNEQGSLRSPFFVSGTGRSMITVREQFLSGCMKPLDVQNIYQLAGFDDTNLQAFMEKFIDVSAVDMEAIVCTYTGRRRHLVTALERYIFEVNPGKDWFMNFAQRMILETGHQLGVVRSIADSAVEAWTNNETRHVLEKIVFTYYLSGGGQVIYPSERRVLTLIDCGLATLREKKRMDDGIETGMYMPLIPWIQGVEGMNVDENHEVVFYEPLVMNALWQHMPRGTVSPYFTNISQGDAAVGINYEKYICPTLGSAFNDKVPAEVMDVVGAAQVYLEKYQLLESRAISPVLVQSINSAGDLDAWIDSIMLGDSFPTYAHTGPLKLKNLSGPDVIFILHNKVQQKKLPVFVQLMTGVNVEPSKAFKSLDVRSFDDFVNSAGSGMFKSWCKSGYIQLIFTTPSHHMRDYSFAERRSTRRVQSDVQPLAGLWSGNRIAGLMRDGKPLELSDAMEELKRNVKRKKN